MSDDGLQTLNHLPPRKVACYSTSSREQYFDWQDSPGRAAKEQATLFADRFPRNVQIVLLMIVVAGIGSFMSSTGVVAIFSLIVLRIARNASIPAERLIMPLSDAALLSGMMTLVATARNLVVQGELVRDGFEGFSYFAFMPFDLPVLALAILYLLIAKQFLGRNGERRVGRKPYAKLLSYVGDCCLAYDKVKADVDMA
ncbi:hypothetical protein LUX29_03995 [Aureimonas altamirensis]|uniref:SLC13 family permease n=1 Tax=Aureimonas altamirensis TaxID=370622 RepID=UPI001E324DD7|nr:SLC13 family permease [Aureimonas altamirensis]UHD46394.1 hypothetical protein LUX29_03995 [Aureimonas altamirensis]